MSKKQKLKMFEAVFAAAFKDRVIYDGRRRGTARLVHTGLTMSPEYISQIFLTTPPEKTLWKHILIKRTMQKPSDLEPKHAQTLGS